MFQHPGIPGHDLFLQKYSSYGDFLNLRKLRCLRNHDGAGRSRLNEITIQQRRETNGIRYHGVLSRLGTWVKTRWLSATCTFVTHLNVIVYEHDRQLLVRTVVNLA